MLDFLFHWPPRMLFGVDSHKKIGEEMQGVSSKALIVCAKGPFRENGLYDDVKNSLERAGIQTYGMGDIDQNPRLSSVREGVAICKKETIDTVVAIGANTMGTGAEELGKTLLKAFVFALTQQDKLPKTVLFYNGGASLTCEGSPMLEDLKTLESEGVEIMTCGTCLNYYGLTEKLAVGSVTNMYAIVEKLIHAGNVVKP